MNWDGRMSPANPAAIRQSPDLLDSEVMTRGPSARHES
jgi:hypothetical protein